MAIALEDPPALDEIAVGRAWVEGVRGERLLLDARVHNGQRLFVRRVSGPPAQRGEMPNVCAGPLEEPSSRAPRWCGACRADAGSVRSNGTLTRVLRLYNGALQY